MMNMSIDISRKIDDPVIVDLLGEINAVAEDLEIPFFLVGAMARDLVLWHGFEIAPGRATRDFDLGVRVVSWDQFAAMKAALIASGNFVDRGTKCRMVFRGTTPIDVLPFGPIDGSRQVTEWPPGDGEQLNMTGFEEAYESALEVRIRAEPELVLRVASPCGLVLLKLIAWNDRKPVNKDAIDLGLLIRSYLQIGNDKRRNDKRLFEEHADLLDVNDFDFELAGAHLLGRDLARICSDKTHKLVLDILRRELNAEGDLPLVVHSAAGSLQIGATLGFWKAIREELEQSGS